MGDLMGDPSRATVYSSRVRAVTGRELRELDQHLAGRGRVDEGDARAAVADPWSLVAELHALGLELGEGAVDILHLEADVEQAGALLADPPGDPGVRPLPLQQLQIGLAHGQHRQTRVTDLLLVLER